jgi:predicted ATP-grasp superfamily ATP-dependent carboligase
MKELATLLRECRPELQAGFLLQEFIPGSGAGYFALFAHGSLLARFSHRRIREKPPSGGVSVVSESSAIDPSIDGPSRELLERLDWHGPAMVEYRISEDGTPYLMEINARFWGSLQLPIYAGIDFPYLAWQIANGELPEAVLDYELGVRNRWLLGDLDHLYLSWKDGAISLRQKLRTTAGFLNVFDSRVRSEVSQPGDRAPFYYELRNYFRRS